jgi:diguanylate cyclase (GGDEF)-like protein
VDYLFRYGGEEFCCLLPETKFDGAVQAAERFRKAVMEMESNFDNSIIKITISLGVSGLNDEINSAEMFIKKADDALYRAKREGRNRVVEMI